MDKVEDDLPEKVGSPVLNDDGTGQDSGPAIERMDSKISDPDVVYYIEKIVSEGYQSIANALEEQNRLLTRLTNSLESRTAASIPHDTNNHPSPSSFTLQDSNQDMRSSGRRHETASRPPSRLQKMSRATENTQEIPSPLHPTPGPRTQGIVSKTSKTLEQRKKDFMTKTTRQQGSDTRDRTRLAIAAAKREMEREQSRSRKMKDMEREESNSLGSWLMFVIIGIMGIAAFVLGIVARIQQSNFYKQQGLQSNSSGEL